MRNIKIETAIRHLFDKGYDIDKTWLRNNKDRISIPLSEYISIVCRECGYTREITIVSACDRSEENPCSQCRAQGQLDRRFGADHIKILEYRSRNKSSKLYCIPSKQVFERRISSMTGGCSPCICSSKKHRHTWKEIKKIVSLLGYELLGNHEDKDIIKVGEKLTLLCKRHGTFDITFNNLNNGHGCRDCGHEIASEKRKLTKKEVQDRIDGVHGEGRYVIGKDYKDTNTACTILCTSCGRTRFVSPNNVINGHRCSCETESCGESFLNDFLSSMGLSYEKQVRFDDCRYKNPLLFDFKVYNSDNIWFLLEFDGNQHFESVENWGGEERLKETQLRDQIKNEYCKENKIFLIRIQSRKREFKPGDRERVVKSLIKAGDIMAFFSKLDREHPYVISVEI